MVDPTTKEKAAAGLWILRQAILELIRERGPLQPSRVTELLGLKCDEHPAPGIALSVMTLMVHTNELDKGEGDHPAYFVKASE